MKLFASGTSSQSRAATVELSVATTISLAQAPPLSSPPMSTSDERETKSSEDADANENAKTYEEEARNGRGLQSHTRGTQVPIQFSVAFLRSGQRLYLPTQTR